MEEWKAADKQGGAATLLPRHEVPHGEYHDESQGELRERKSLKSVLWVVLGTTATVTTRALLRGDFRKLISPLLGRCQVLV
jgi:hypothetical protein